MWYGDSLNAMLSTDRVFACHIDCQARGQGRWERSKLDHVRLMPELKCAASSIAGKWKENAVRTTPTYSWFRHCPSSLTHLPPRRSRRWGRQTVLPPHLQGREMSYVSRFAIIRLLDQAPSRSTNGPDPWSSLSLVPDSPSCCSEEFTELAAKLHITHPTWNRISSLSLPPFALVAQPFQRPTLHFGVVMTSFSPPGSVSSPSLSRFWAYIYAG